MYRGCVLDLDGTVYRGRDAIPGAADAIGRLRERGLSLLFCSNNPTKGREAYVDRLAGFGIEATPGEVLSAGTVTTQYLADHHADDTVFLVGSEGLREQFEAADLRLTETPEETDVLVASWTHDFEYGDMTDAYRALHDGGVLIGSDPDVVIPTEGDRMVPGSGAILHAVEGVLEREADRVLGKPSTEAIEMAREALGVPLEECLVVGDRLNTDLAMGERAGMTTVLVRTGVATDADVAASDVTPDFVVDSLVDIDEVLDRGRD